MRRRSLGAREDLRRNQSSIALRRRSSGTRLPASSRPSAMGRVSSKTASLVKLRMAKLSSCAMGQAWAWPAASMREMESFRRYTVARYRVLCARRKAGLVLRRPFDVVDYHHLHRPSRRFQFQPKLFLQRGGDGRTAGPEVAGSSGVHPLIECEFQGEIVGLGRQACLVLDRPPREAAEEALRKRR